MGKTAYPTAADLDNYLATQVGLTTTGLDEATAIADGILDFETAVNQVMLATADTVRYYDPPGNRDGFLDLRAPLANITSVVYLGQTLVVGTVGTNTGEYWPMPYNAPQESKPYRYLRFWRRWWEPITSPNFQQIVITGRWGYGANAGGGNWGIPENAWDAMIRRAAWKLLPAIQHGIAHGLISWTEAGVTEQYGSRPLEYLRTMWCGDDGNGGAYGSAVGLFRWTSM